MIFFGDRKALVGNFLSHHVWNASPLKVAKITVALILICFALENALEAVTDWIATFSGFPSRLDAIKNIQSSESWISPLLVAPLLENLACLFLLRACFSREARAWWRGPLIVSIFIGLIHALLYWEARYMAVSINFFAMCCLMANTRNSATGFWASVVLHSGINLLVLIHLTYV